MEQMTRNNQGDDGDDGSYEELPRPEVALKEEGCEREGGSNDATNNLRSEAQDDTRDETTHADE